MDDTGLHVQPPQRVHAEGKVVDKEKKKKKNKIVRVYLGYARAARDFQRAKESPPFVLVFVLTCSSTAP